MIGRLLRNLLGCNDQTFKPACKADFTPCAMAGSVADCSSMDEEWPVQVERQRDRDNEGATKRPGVFVRAMLEGRSLSVQQFSLLLKQEGFGKANWPGTVIGVGRRWLQRQGVNVRWRWEKTRTGKRHKVWWVETRELACRGFVSAKAAYNAKNKGREVR